MEYHELANMFPLLVGEDYIAFRDDIEKNGQQEHILVYDEKIIDGRNRYRACCDLGIQPKYKQWHGNGSLASYIVSLNLHRRHLTASQRAAIALDVLPELEKEAEKRKREAGIANLPTSGGKITTTQESGKSSELAAAMFNTGEKYVRDAKTIKEKAPDILERVKSGELNIPKAKRELRIREDNEKIKELERDREIDPYDYDARFENWPSKENGESVELDGMVSVPSKGYINLAMAIISQAIKDAVEYPNADCNDNPREWLLSTDCRFYCECAGKDHEIVKAWVDMDCPTTPMHESLISNLTNNL